MLKTIKQEILNKKVVILGYGREGKSTYKLISEIGGYEKLAIADLNQVTDDIPEQVEKISGEKYQDGLDDFDIVFKSPGVVLKKDISEYKCRVTSQTQMFFSRYRNQIVGITGTKGKSTTTTLIYQILKSSQRDVILAGNIGIPVFDQWRGITNDTEIIVELSSHQLEYMTVSPHIGILLNIHEEHLDHYGTMEKYVRAKQNIYRYQLKEDVLFCLEDILPAAGDCVADIIKFPCDDGVNLYSGEVSIGGETNINSETITFRGNSFEIPVSEISIVGTHNYLDIAVAYGVCKLLGIRDEEFRTGLISYVPLPHRLQNIGTYEGVTYYDDSISTICDTTIQALGSIKNVETVLIGGMDRGIKYDDLIEFLSGHPIENIILMEATGERIYREIQSDYPQFRRKERLYRVKDLREAVKLSKNITPKGKSCVLSPAAASYGIFKNFEERGSVFEEYVREL